MRIMTTIQILGMLRPVRYGMCVHNCMGSLLVVGHCGTNIVELELLTVIDCLLAFRQAWSAL